MTSINVDCAIFGSLLSAWLESDLDPASASAMELHAAGCNACAALAADLRAIHARAASLPALTPSRDLWAGIEARIAAPVIPISGAFPAAARHRQHAVEAGRPRRTWIRPSLAAAALVLVTAGITHIIESRVTERPAAAAPARVAINAPTESALSFKGIAGGSAGGSVPLKAVPVNTLAPATAAPQAGVVAPTTSVASTPGASNAEAYRLTGNLAVSNVEASYDGEITRLRAIVDRNRGQLDTSTVRVLEHNMQVIDSAIVQCQRALEHDPGSHFLIESLDNALRSKVELLRTTATMSS